MNDHRPDQLAREALRRGPAGRRLKVSARALVAAFSLLGLLALHFGSLAAAALAPAFEQVRHFAWRTDDGAPANIQGIAQSPDGFMWLASAAGLYRFDGLTFDHIPLEGGDGNQSLQVASVAAAPNGDVWVGYDWGGMAVYRNGHLRPSNPGTPSKGSVYLAVTRDGALWARANGSKGNRLVRFKDGKWSDVDESWNLPIGTNSIAMLVARDGTLYLVNPDGLRRLAPGGRRFEFQPVVLGFGPTIAEDERGRIWIADSERLFRVEFGTGAVGPVTRLPHSNLYRRLLFDANGAAWLAGAEDGVRRLLPDASRDRFTVADSAYASASGLSSDVTLAMAKDREHNIWVGTLLGVDRFSSRRAIRDSGLPLSYVFDTFAGSRGEAYLISNDTLFRIGAAGPERLAEIRSAETICGDRDGNVTVASPTGLFVYAKGEVRSLALPVPVREMRSRIYACAFDTDGGLLLSSNQQPLYRLGAAGWRPVAPPLSTAVEGAYGMLPAPGGGTLLVYPKDRIARLLRERRETLWSSSEGTIGFIKTAAPGRRCTLIGAQNGLGCLGGGQMKILSAATYPELTNVSGIVERPEGWTWLIGLQGIMRVKTAELYAAFDAPGRPLHFQPFGVEDGIRGETMMMHPRNIVADRFGRLWFFTSKGLVSIELDKIDASPPAPHVIIKSLTANGHVFDTHSAIELPAGTRSFQIDYTATALGDPKGTNFRYRLEGVDAEWNSVGARRQAFYTNLSPGTYRFRVAAMSSAGARSVADATVDIRIEPSFVQTRSFAVICVLLALGLATFLYRWRVHSLSVRLQERMQERVDERERIARELHDTLLQGVSGLLLRFQSLSSRVTGDPALRGDMEKALDQAEDLVIEGRNRVRNLRGKDEPRDLEEVLAMALIQPGLGQPLEVRLERAGSARMVTAAAAEELAAIAVEARGNAIRHGGAGKFTVAMAFEARQLVVTFDDDGTGIPPEILAAGSRPGHFGLIGMRERAERLQGKFEVGRPPAGGTRIRVMVPARCAYSGNTPFLAALGQLFRSRNG